MLEKQDNPAHFGINKPSGAGKGSKPRTDTTTPAYQANKLWTRSTCCDAKVVWETAPCMADVAICQKCGTKCNTYQK
jgi:hypothetical protein